MELFEYEVRDVVRFAWEKQMFSGGDRLYITESYDAIGTANQSKRMKVFNHCCEFVGEIFPRYFDEAISKGWIKEVVR